MAEIHAAESDNPDVGGLIVAFPSGKTKSIAWKSRVPIEPTLEAAKQYAADLIQVMIDEGSSDDIERTNIPSLVACFQRVLMDWNDKCKARIYAAGVPATLQ